MSTFDSVGSVPEAPLRADLRSVSESGASRTAGRDLLCEVRRVLEAMAVAPDVVGQLSEGEVTELAACGVALTRAGEALAVAATVEAVDRGSVATSTNASATQWVRALGIGVEPHQARRIADVAEKIAARSGLLREGPPLGRLAAGSDDPDAGEGGAADHPAGGDDGPVARLVAADPSGRLLLAEAVASGAVNVRAAHRAMKEAPRVQRLIPSASAAEVLSWFLALGDDATDRDRRALTRRLVARYDPDQLSREETTEQAREHLTFYELPCGMVRLTADLSKGHAARVKQAIGKLSAPQPCPCDDAGGEPVRDDRLPGKRRADALVELINLATDHVAGAGAGSITGNAKAVVTVDLDTLLGALGESRAAGAGTTPYGDILDVTTIRQIACGAGIIPVVLGAEGQPVDVGREERLFTGRLRTAVALRDQECTFPGCDRPPDWCQVHHLIPWWSGGPTTRDNGALLCERHHTIVHRDGLTGALKDGRVLWDLTPGLLHQWPRAG